jgi:hypothetical protein
MEPAPEISLFSKRPDGLWGPPNLRLMGVNLTADLQIVLRLRMSGAIPLFSLYTVTAWTGTSPSTLNFIL